MQSHPMIIKPSPEISLDALRSGDRNALAQFVEAYSAQIYQLALKMLNNTQDAEDVLQNTFLKAFQHIDGFEGRSSLSTWLYRIAANEALMMIRKRRPEITEADGRMMDGEGEEITPTEFIDWGLLPEEELLSGESKDRLDQAVQNLPEKLRIVFLLRDIEGLSIKETAQSLELSEAVVKTRLLRARLRLREALAAYYRERLGSE
jgi:RNA polymerase sigma-70 factor (ECF subfamily)